VATALRLLGVLAAKTPSLPLPSGRASVLPRLLQVEASVILVIGGIRQFQYSRPNCHLRTEGLAARSQSGVRAAFLAADRVRDHHATSETIGGCECCIICSVTAGHLDSTSSRGHDGSAAGQGCVGQIGVQVAYAADLGIGCGCANIPRSQSVCLTVCHSPPF
jgi:hypothetical protein